MTLFVVAAIGLSTGACTLQSLTGSSTYSALQPDASGIATTPGARAAVAAVPDGFVEAPAPAAMPGDLRRPLAQAPGRGIEPVAALTASAHARGQWETLRPGELTRTPTIMQQAGHGGGAATTSGLANSANRSTAAAANAKSYDREAAMQSLINGGRSAGKGICSGC